MMISCQRGKKENESEEDKDVKEKESEADKRERKKGSLEQKKNNSFYFVSTVNVLSYSPDPPTLFVCINLCGQSKRPRIIQN